MDLESKDFYDLKKAELLLNSVDYAGKVSYMIGRPINEGFSYLPDNCKTVLNKFTQEALKKAIGAVIFTSIPKPKSSKGFSQTAISIAAGVRGSYGLPVLVFELPISTITMMRSIVDIARRNGEDLSSLETKIACIEVFALGGFDRSKSSNKLQYFKILKRLSSLAPDLAKNLTEIDQFEADMPELLNYIARVTEYFLTQVVEKAAALAIPSIGANGGALINTLFFRHFQDVANGHFILRRLIKKYDREMIQEALEDLANAQEQDSLKFNDMQPVFS